MPHDLIPILGVICLFGLPAWFRHQQKMMELRMQAQQQTDQNLAAELRELKNQMAELRDTTTRYDMSFDSALQRLEGRIGQLERRETVSNEPGTLPLQQR